MHDSQIKLASACGAGNDQESLAIKFFSGVSLVDKRIRLTEYSRLKPLRFQPLVHRLHTVEGDRLFVYRNTSYRAADSADNE